MSEKERQLRLLACQVASRAAIFEDAANGDWLHDPINYFAGISERCAAERYLAEAKAEAEKAEKIKQLESKIKSWEAYAAEEKKQAESYQQLNFCLWCEHNQHYCIALDEIRKLEEDLSSVKAE